VGIEEQQTILSDPPKGKRSWMATNTSHSGKPSPQEVHLPKERVRIEEQQTSLFDSPKRNQEYDEQCEESYPFDIQLFRAKWTTLSKEQKSKQETRGMQKFFEDNPKIRNKVLCMFPGGRVRVSKLNAGSVEGWKSLHITVPGSSMGVPCFPTEVSCPCIDSARSLCAGNGYLQMNQVKKPTWDFDKSEPSFEESAYDRLLGGYRMHSHNRFYEIDGSYDYDPNHPAPDIVKMHHVWQQSKCAHPHKASTGRE
jgi:hypothetical protein